MLLIIRIHQHLNVKASQVTSLLFISIPYSVLPAHRNKQKEVVKLKLNLSSKKVIESK